MFNADFLQSRRFWGIVIVALAMYAYNLNVIDKAMLELITTIAAGFVTIRSWDKLVESVGKKK